MLRQQANLITVASKQFQHLLFIRRKICQCHFHSLGQVLELGKVFVVGGLFLGVAPQILDGIVIGRVAGLPRHRDALPVRLKELLGAGTGVITGSILNPEEMSFGLTQHVTTNSC